MEGSSDAAFSRCRPGAGDEAAAVVGRRALGKRGGGGGTRADSPRQRNLHPNLGHRGRRKCIMPLGWVFPSPDQKSIEPDGCGPFASGCWRCLYTHKNVLTQPGDMPASKFLSISTFRPKGSPHNVDKEMIFCYQYYYVNGQEIFHYSRLTGGCGKT
jgi:hypothetical protein